MLRGKTPRLSRHRGIVARKTNLFDGAKKPSMPLHKCNPKRHLSCYDNNNSDDKRLVPTGPNPLHNSYAKEEIGTKCAMNMT
ncbi:hypothetical protein Fmac_013155 [Flemingia macrophylla]|uniref:Clavata3/ESR (CLE) gene family member n=1 Tax=Flemingia macrophylla TaxID=520843 RepID=A0ABD1MSE5_9FABA